VVIGTGVVFTEVGVEERMVRWLIVEPEKEELSRLYPRLELEGDLSEWASVV
jgi:hypothetical protein